MHRRLLGLAGVAAGLLPGCGSGMPATLNPVRIERAIAGSIRAQRGVDATVACPPAQPIKAHRQFRCVAEVGAHNTPFLVTETDSSGHVSYVGLSPSATPQVDGRRVAHEIAQLLAAHRHVHAAVRCPSGIPLQQGLAFICIATTASGSTTQFEVRQTDGRGHVTYRAR